MRALFVVAYTQLCATYPRYTILFERRSIGQCCSVECVRTDLSYSQIAQIHLREGAKSVERVRFDIEYGISLEDKDREIGRRVERVARNRNIALFSRSKYCNCSKDPLSAC